MQDRAHARTVRRRQVISSSPYLTCPHYHLSGSLLTRISTTFSLTEQSYHLMVHACPGHSDPALCQAYLKTSWPAMARCLYHDLDLGAMACQHYGGCLHSSQAWTCRDVGSLMGQALADSPYTTYGAEQLLHGPCYCQQSSDCQHTVSELLPTVLPEAASWVSVHTVTVCGGGGEDTCAQCRGEAGRQGYL